MLCQGVLTTLLHALFFAATAMAQAEGGVAASSHGNAWKFGTGGGIIGFIILILDIIVFVEIFQSNRPPLHKLLWALGVFFFPVLGLIVYYLFSNRTEHMAGSGGYESIA